MARKYGWKRSLPDFRDRVFVPPSIELPPIVDLRSKMPEVYDQGQLGSCHHRDTEVLTDTGWKYFYELTGSERVATVDPVTGKMIFEIPTRIVRYPYKGQMICSSNESLDFRVTPDHKMLVRKWNEKNRKLDSDYQFVEASKLGWYCGLMNRINWDGESKVNAFTLPGVDHKHIPQRSPRDIPMDAWLRFLGIYIAEGSMCKDRKHYKIQIAASKEREKEFCRDVFERIEVKALELKDRFTFDNRQIYEAMVSLGFLGVIAAFKRVPSFVFKQSSEMIKEFLAGHFAGDGSDDDGLKAHYTSSYELASDLQTLIFLSGNESRISVREARVSVMADGREVRGKWPEHRISVCERKNLSIDRKDQIFTLDYDGNVFCAEVPTYHTLVTRYNGKILISGNCTANASGAAFQYDYELENGNSYVPSRLYIYYYERAIEGTIGDDAGATCRDSMKALALMGAPPEASWPYKIGKFAKKPPIPVQHEGRQHLAKIYESVPQDLNSMQATLASLRPIVVGFSVYSSFESDSVKLTGVVPMPDPSESMLGGHAVLVVGYDTPRQVWIVRNSWSADWGDQGYFYLPFQYLTDSNLAGDFWVLKTVG